MPDVKFEVHYKCVECGMTRITHNDNLDAAKHWVFVHDDPRNFDRHLLGGPYVGWCPKCWKGK